MNTHCSHNISFNEQCARCEILGLEESLKWMAPKVKLDEKRLTYLKHKIENEKKEMLNRENR